MTANTPILRSSNGLTDLRAEGASAVRLPTASVLRTSTGTVKMAAIVFGFRDNGLWYRMPRLLLSRTALALPWSGPTWTPMVQCRFVASYPAPVLRARNGQHECHPLPAVAATADNVDMEVLVGQIIGAAGGAIPRRSWRQGDARH